MGGRREVVIEGVEFGFMIRIDFGGGGGGGGMFGWMYWCWVVEMVID